MSSNNFEYLNQIVIEFDKDEREKYLQFVQGLYKESDVSAKISVQKLLKTAKTFENSLGEIEAYLKDKKKCLNCPASNLLVCEKKGYTLSLSYDESYDQIRTYSAMCPRLYELHQRLSNFLLSDYEPLFIYQQAVSIFEMLQKMDNLKQMHSLQKLLAQLKTASLKSGEKGLIIANEDRKFSRDLIFLCSYTLASRGKKVAVIDTENFFKNLFSFDDVISEKTRSDLYMVLKADALCFINLDSLPFVSRENFEKYIKKIIDKVNANDILVYGNILSKSNYRRLLKNRELIYGKEEKAFESLAPLFIVTDFDLR